MKITELLDPTSEQQPMQRTQAPAVTSLQDGSVALLDIAKPRGSVFLDRLEELLLERGVSVERFRKPTHAKIAPPDLRREISERCRAAVVALAD